MDYISSKNNTERKKDTMTTFMNRFGNNEQSLIFKQYYKKPSSIFHKKKLTFDIYDPNYFNEESPKFSFENDKNINNYRSYMKNKSIAIDRCSLNYIEYMKKVFQNKNTKYTHKTNNNLNYNYYNNLDSNNDINNNNKDISNNNDNIDINNNNNEEDQKINELLQLLEVDNINETKDKIQELIEMEDFTNKVISLFIQFNGKNNNQEENDIDLNDILFWISYAVKYNKENEEYEKYCKELMKVNNINNFEELKSFINNILNRNKKNNNFIGGVKKILSSNIDDNNNANIIDNIHIKF